MPFLLVGDMGKSIPFTVEPQYNAVLASHTLLTVLYYLGHGMALPGGGRWSCDHTSPISLPNYQHQ